MSTATQRTAGQWRRLSASILGGVVLTLLTGLVPVRHLMGATHYGFPFAWLTRLVLAPQYFPWRVQWLGLLADVVVWSAVAYALWVVAARAR